MASPPPAAGGRRPPAPPAPPRTRPPRPPPPRRLANDRPPPPRGRGMADVVQLVLLLAPPLLPLALELRQQPLPLGLRQRLRADVLPPPAMIDQPLPQLLVGPGSADRL